MSLRSNRPDRAATLGLLAGTAREYLAARLTTARLNWLSWVAWAAGVLAFALWTLWHYRAPAQPAWIGMTVHTFAFGSWLLVLREWFMLAVRRSRRTRDS